MLAAAKNYWQKAADKIDAMNLRERGLVFCMAALIIVTFVDTGFIEPLLARQKVLSQQVVQQQGAIKAIQVQLQALAQARLQDPDAATRAQVEALRQELATTEAFLQGKQQQLVPPGEMVRLLEQALSKNKRLELVLLRTLPAAGLPEAQSQSAAKAGASVKAASPSASAQKQIFKHGVEIAVRGNYLDLLAYVTELEKLPWQMFWGKADLRVEQYPAATLTLTVYTLSLDKAWMTI